MDSRNRISAESIVDAVFQLHWRSEVVRHTEMYHASAVNMWRDLLPTELAAKLAGKELGDRVE